MLHFVTHAPLDFAANGDSGTLSSVLALSLAMSDEEVESEG